MDVAFGVISSVSSAFWAMFGRCRRIKLPPILRLDGELLAGVAERCSPDDLRHLRLACNTLATAGAQCIKRLRFCAADTSHEHLPSRWQGFTSVEELVIKYANGSGPFKEAELTRVLPQLLGQRQERLVEVRLMQSPEDIKTPLDCLRGLTSLQHLTLEQYYRIKDHDDLSALPSLTTLSSLELKGEGFYWFRDLTSELSPLTGLTRLFLPRLTAATAANLPPGLLRLGLYEADAAAICGLARRCVLLQRLKILEPVESEGDEFIEDPDGEEAAGQLIGEEGLVFLALTHLAIDFKRCRMFGGCSFPSLARFEVGSLEEEVEESEIDYMVKAEEYEEEKMFRERYLGVFSDDELPFEHVNSARVEGLVKVGCQAREWVQVSIAKWNASDLLRALARVPALRALDVKGAGLPPRDVLAPLTQLSHLVLRWGAHASDASLIYTVTPLCHHLRRLWIQPPREPGFSWVHDRQPHDWSGFMTWLAGSGHNLKEVRLHAEIGYGPDDEQHLAAFHHNAQALRQQGVKVEHWVEYRRLPSFDL